MDMTFGDIQSLEKKKRCDALRANLPCFHLSFLPASQAKRTLEANVPNFSSLNFPDSFFCIHVGPSVRISAAAHGWVRFRPRCSSFCLSSSLRASSTVWLLAPAVTSCQDQGGFLTNHGGRWHQRGSDIRKTSHSWLFHNSIYPPPPTPPIFSSLLPPAAVVVVKLH